jgi:nickel-dependent lactate racemase
MTPARIKLDYGTVGLEVDVPSPDVTTLVPRQLPGLADEEASFRAALRNPIGSPPLRELVHSTDRVAIVIPDITRPCPNQRLLAWTLEELSHVPNGNFVIVSGTGSHRVNDCEELLSLVGPDIMTRIRVVNHTAHDPSRVRPAGQTADGRTISLNVEYLEADRRIVIGFIEPHFMAGFSGGYKGVFPGVADIDSIMHYHRAEVIGDPRSTWGRLEDNPTQEQIRRNGSLVPVDFCINVTLNRERRITGIFCGEVLAAHREGCSFAEMTAMTPCPKSFPIVITTNSGYPLDQNLYQSVKGMSAAAQIVQEGGLIVTASRCNDGFPAHGNFRKLLFDHSSPGSILETIMRPGFSMYDQWEAQLLAIILLKARVALYSEIPEEEVRQAHLLAVSDITACIRDELARIGREAPVAVLPEGPMTIPYIV